MYTRKYQTLCADEPIKLIKSVHKTDLLSQLSDSKGFQLISEAASGGVL